VQPTRKNKKFGTIDAVETSPCMVHLHILLKKKVVIYLKSVILEHILIKTRNIARELMIK
jgi:hypothetical protein